MNELTISQKSLKPSDIEKIFKVDSKLSPLTVKGYAASSIQFFTYVKSMGLAGIEAVNSSTIAHYKQYLIEQGFKNGTINYKLKAVRSFYRQLVKADRIEKNPTDGLAYEHEEKFTAEYKALTKSQIRVLLRELSKDQSERGLQRYAIILLLTLTGVRASEACNLKLSDIVSDNGQAVAVRVIRGKGGKNRTVEFKQGILDAIRAYRDMAGVSGEYLFYTIPQNSKQTRQPLNRFTLWYTVKRICKNILNIDVHPHSFRHTFCTVSLELGADIASISQAAGHSSLDMTSRYLARRGSVLQYWKGLIPDAV